MTARCRPPCVRGIKGAPDCEEPLCEVRDERDEKLGGALVFSLGLGVRVTMAARPRAQLLVRRLELHSSVPRARVLSVARQPRAAVRTCKHRMQVRAQKRSRCATRLELSLCTCMHRTVAS